MPENAVSQRIPVAQPSFGGNELRYVSECVTTGWVSSNGAFIKKFEDNFASYCGTKYGIAVSNGTVSLHLCMLALDIGPGDEVIVPTFTYVAAVAAILYAGAKPVFMESETRTWNLDPAKIETVITKKTKAIMAVHTYGHPVDMDPLLAVAKKHGLHVIEDAAEAHGATYKGKRVGGFGIVSSFSFFGNKTVTCGEGGMVMTNDPALNEKIRLLKGQGMDPKRRYWHPVVGYNYRMTNIAAALGLAQMEQIDQFLNYRHTMAARYDKLFADLRDKVDTPLVEPWATHSFWMYSVALKDSVKISRDAVIDALEARGIETRPFFFPAHVMPPYREFGHGSYPLAEKISARGINLPSFVGISEEQQVRVVEALKKLL